MLEVCIHRNCRIYILVCHRPTDFDFGTYALHAMEDVDKNGNLIDEYFLT